MKFRLLEKSLLPRLHHQKFQWQKRTGYQENLVPKKKKKMNCLMMK